MPKSKPASAPVAAPVAAPAPIVSVRDGGTRAARLARDLSQFGEEMLALWPALAKDFAEGDALWANFDAGVIDAYDARHPAVIVVRGEKGWSRVPSGYVKGEAQDRALTASLVRGYSRTAWANFKKDDPSFYALAAEVAGKARIAIREGRRTLRIGVSKAIAGTANRTRGGNREFAIWIADQTKTIADKVKTGLTRATVSEEQAKAVREWLAKAPKL